MEEESTEGWFGMGGLLSPVQRSNAADTAMFVRVGGQTFPQASSKEQSRRCQMGNPWLRCCVLISFSCGGESGSCGGSTLADGAKFSTCKLFRVLFDHFDVGWVN